jgi:hypothetical protein
VRFRRSLANLLVAASIGVAGATGADVVGAIPGRPGFLPGGAAAVAAPDTAPAPHYAGIRVVRAVPGAPSTPRITLPPGYRLLAGDRHRAASRSEFTAFIRGPRSERGIPVTIDWPEASVGSVVAADTRLALHRHAGAPHRVTVVVPVVWSSPDANQATLQVWSMLSRSTASGLLWRIEHNDPDRAVGPWAGGPWPAVQATAVVNWMVAAEAVLRDSGLIAEARRRGHFFSLMGFETNNPLHPDNPPHWHLAYYPGRDHGAPRAQVPHFWVDERGGTFYNGMDVQGAGRRAFRAGEPARIHAPDGTLLVTLTIRADGGLDIAPAVGPRYSITAPDGNFGHSVDVARAGVPWRSFATRDDVKIGVLVVQVRDAGSTAPHRTTVYRYDALTGVLSGS